MPTDEQPVAIITGAGSGVGRALALILAKSGYRVALAARTEADLEHTAALIREQTPDAQTLVVPTDVGEPAAAQTLVDAAVGHFGRVDALANVAGSAPLQPIPRITDDGLRQTLAVNFESVVYLTRACWPIFKRQNSGVVANVSSKASVDPFTGFNMYGAAKAAVNLFTRATADEGKRIGVKAYCIAPGAIETGMLRAAFSEKILPHEKTLAPEEVAQAVADCITGESTVENGETFVMDSP